MAALLKIMEIVLRDLSLLTKHDRIYSMYKLAYLDMPYVHPSAYLIIISIYSFNTPFANK